MTGLGDRGGKLWICLRPAALDEHRGATFLSASVDRMSSVTPARGRPVGVLDVERQRNAEAPALALHAGDDDAAGEHALEDEVDHAPARPASSACPAWSSDGSRVVDAVEALQAHGQRLQLGLGREVDQRLEEVVP